MFKLFSPILCAVILSGCCCRVGPGQMQQDTICYNQAVQTSTDQQVLLNLVRLRYRDTPIFLDIGVISATYDIHRSLASDFTIDNSIHRSGLDLTEIVPKIGYSYSEKPTTTYSPLAGQKFVTQLLNPISINRVVLLNDMGWRIDRLFRCCIQRINALQNAPTASGPTPYHEPTFKDFLTLMNVLHELELRDAIHLLPRNNPNTGKAELVMKLQVNRADPELLTKAWQLLDVDEGIDTIRLAPISANSRERDEIFLDVRSPLSILYFLSQAVEVPYSHEACQLVTSTEDSQGYLFNWSEVLGGLIRIRHGNPSNAAVSIYYRQTPFFIADNDLESKSTFSMLSQLLALQFGEAQLPLLTLPIN